MREGIIAALGTLALAFGIATVAMAGMTPEAHSPEAGAPTLVLSPPPAISREPEIVFHDSPTFLSREPEIVFNTPEPEPEPQEAPDTRVAAEPIEAAAPETENTGMGSDVEQWRGLVTAYFGAGADVALCLMAHESGGNPSAQNPSSGASGLMQVLPSWADDFGVTPDDLFDPDVNLMISAALYADGGWGHWSPWNRGECR